MCVKILKNILVVGQYAIPIREVNTVRYDDSDNTILVEYQDSHNTGWQSCSQEEHQALLQAWGSYLESLKPVTENVKRV